MVLDDARAALDLLRRGCTPRLPIFPLRGERHFLDARHQYRIEMAAHLDQDELAISAILTVQIDYRVPGRTRSGEEIDTEGIVFDTCPKDGVADGVNRLRVGERVVSSDYVAKQIGTEGAGIIS